MSKRKRVETGKSKKNLLIQFKARMSFKPCRNWIFIFA